MRSRTKDIFTPNMVFPRAIYSILNWLLTLAILCSINAQNITNTTLRDGQVACANTDVTFTCQTIGSTAIAWRSAQFIGAGNNARLIFSFDVDSPGRTREGIEPTTVAMLTRNEDLNGMRLLESSLRVRVPASLSTLLSVTCLHLDNDVDISVNFSVLSVPDVVQNAVAVQVPCLNSTACLAVASWYPPSNSQSANVTHYIGSVTVGGVELFTTTNIYAGLNETALSAYYVVPNCTTNNDLQNVGWSLVAANQCGEGPRQNVLLLPNPADNSGEVICLPDTDQPTSPGASSALRCSMWIVNGAVVLALMKYIL